MNENNECVFCEIRTYNRLGEPKMCKEVDLYPVSRGELLKGFEQGSDIIDYICILGS